MSDVMSTTIVFVGLACSGYLNYMLGLARYMDDVVACCLLCANSGDCLTVSKGAHVQRDLCCPCTLTRNNGGTGKSKGRGAAAGEWHLSMHCAATRPVGTSIQLLDCTQVRMVGLMFS